MSGKITCLRANVTEVKCYLTMLLYYLISNAKLVHVHGFPLTIKCFSGAMLLFRHTIALPFYILINTVVNTYWLSFLQ